jgi:SMI1 / KNR4 family (SUKH-1)
MKDLSYLQGAVARYKDIASEANGQILGCSSDEIAALEATLNTGYHIPAAYREFLEYGAKHWGRLFQTRDLSYQSALAMAQAAYRDWEGPVFPEGEGTFPDNLFIFEDGQGMYFFFFYLDAGENPPVYCWKETMDSFEEVTLQADHFSDYLVQLMDLHKKALEFKV